MTGPSRILVGRFGAPQGVKGEVRLKSFTAEPAAIARYRPLWDAGGERSFAILAVRPLRDDMLVVRLDGVTDRTDAEHLTNIELFVDRDLLPSPDEDEFYHVDLIGLSAEVADGRALGTVSGVENYGGGDLLVIAPPAGDTILVPFTKAFVPVVDFERRRVVVVPGAVEEAAGEDHLP